MTDGDSAGQPRRVVNQRMKCADSYGVTSEDPQRILARLDTDDRRQEQRFPSPEPERRACETCGRRPAIVVKLRSTDGYVVNQTMKSSRPIALCKECGLQALHQAQKAVGVGVVTRNLPYVLARNHKWIVRLEQLPDPQ